MQYQQAHDEISLLADAAPMNRELNKGVAWLANFGKSIAVMGGKFAALGGLGLSTGLAALTQFLDQGEGLSRLSRLTGTSVESLASLEAVARSVGGNLGTVQSALGGIDGFLQQVAQGSGEAITTLGRLGLSFDSLRRMSQPERLEAVAEALTLAVKAGADPAAVVEAIRGGLAGSKVLDAKAPMMLDRTFAPGFRINLHIKDLGTVLDTGHGVDAPLPLTAAVREMMTALSADGLAGDDHSSLVRYYEKLGNCTVTRPMRPRPATTSRNSSVADGAVRLLDVEGDDIDAVVMIYAERRIAEGA